MTLLEHIRELRHRLVLGVGALLIGAVLGFIWFSNSIPPIPTLGDILRAPYCSLPDELRANLTEAEDGGCRLLATAPFEIFLLRFKVGIAVGAVLTSPVWLYQLWAFITPGLYSKERRFASIFVGAAATLFAAGAVLAYYVVPQGLRVLLSFGGDSFTVALTGQRYINFILALLLIFGVSFELPLLVVMLNQIGVLPYEKLKRWRRGLLFTLFAFAALATPGTDPISMLALAIALSILFEFSIQIARIHDRRAAKKQPHDPWAGLSPDEASPLDVGFNTVDYDTVDYYSGGSSTSAGSGSGGDGAGPPRSAPPHAGTSNFDDIT